MCRAQLLSIQLVSFFRDDAQGSCNLSAQRGYDEEASTLRLPPSPVTFEVRSDGPPRRCALMRLLQSPLFAFLLASVVLDSACSQCDSEWWTPSGIAGVHEDPIIDHSRIYTSTHWDPDGNGPRDPVWVVGGNFTSAGAVEAGRIAAYDPVTDRWSTFGEGMNDHVYALAVLPNGDLVAGGEFTTAGGSSAQHIARWDGRSWSALGQMNDTVHALAVLPNGHLVAGGDFTTAVPGQWMSRIAAWDGTNWSALGSSTLGSGFGGGPVFALEVLPNGDLIAGGAMSRLDGRTIRNIVRWDGTTWSDLGAGIPGGSWSELGRRAPVNDIARLGNGELIVCGTGSTYPIWRWNGTTWSQIPGMAGSLIKSVAVEPGPAGRIVAGGVLTTNGWNGLATWDGANWATVGGGMTIGSEIEQVSYAPNGDLYVGGEFHGMGSQGAASAARFDGSQWHALGSGFNGDILALKAIPGGFLAGGDFTTAGAVSAWAIARWDGTDWAGFGTGLARPSSSGSQRAKVYDIEVLPNGDVVVAGDFEYAGGAVIQSVALWNGSRWVNIHGPFGTRHLEVLPSGDLVAATFSNVRLWDGSSWMPLGPPLGIMDLLVMSNGNLIAATRNDVLRFNGSVWSSIGVAVGDVTTLGELANGDLVASGLFQSIQGVSAQHIAGFDGANWYPLGVGLDDAARALKTLPTGDLVAGGSFTQAGGLPIPYLARWDGVRWSEIAGGVDEAVYELESLSDGTLLVGGRFMSAAGNARSFLNVLAPDCPSGHLARLASESFAYPLGSLDGRGGGSGFAGPWRSSANAAVTLSGFDAVGERATTLVANATCDRTLDALAWPDPSQVENAQFGVDGSTVWMRFQAQRQAGSDDLYGGVQLLDRTGTPRLFLGCPRPTTRWGFSQSPNANPQTVAGSNVDRPTTLVYRIDFLAGSEWVSLWLDPPSPYPASAPDASGPVPDFCFDQLRIQSGGGSTTGYHVDALEVEMSSGPLRADLEEFSALTGGIQRLTLHLDPARYWNKPYFIIGSMSGTYPGLPLGGPLWVPLNPDPFTLFSMEFANRVPYYANSVSLTNGAGQATAFFRVPASLALPAIGNTIHHAAVVLDAAGNVAFVTNPVGFAIVP